MALQIVRNNIINVEADAIVNTANPKVAVGMGVDQAIYEAAGWDELLEARAEIGEMAPGEVAHTPAFGLHAKYIIHAIGPAWRGGDHGERETVSKCYSGALALAAELGCESIAFPLLATGTYGFPKDEALKIAIREISGFLLDNEMEVMLVVFDKESFEVSGKLFSDIRAFIGDSEAVYDSSRRGGRGRGRFHNLRMKREREDAAKTKLYEDRSLEIEEACTPEEDVAFDEDIAFGLDGVMMSESVGAPAPSFPTAGQSLQDRFLHLDKTFQEYLFMLIDRRGLEDTEVYKRANIDRKHFSKIRSNVDYKPSKKTALAFALALHLNLDETRDLLARAGLALSPSMVFDRIIEYCIETGNYDIHEINCILFEYDQQMLGA